MTFNSGYLALNIAAFQHAEAVLKRVAPVNRWPLSAFILSW